MRRPGLALRVRYRCAGRDLEVGGPGQTILDISIAGKIPHWRECGGRGKCSTCRVRVLDGAANLSPANAIERRLATARKWDPTIRLACQAQVLGDVTLERVLLSGADISQLQIETLDTRTGVDQSVAILFCDMRNFSGFAESHSAFDVVHVLNRFFASVGEPILLNGGVINLYVGDEISGSFGLDGGSAERACRAAVTAALGIAEAVDRLNASIRADFGFDLAVGIGVHFGPVVIGELGHPAHRQFSVIGDSVNTASRIQAINKELGTTVLVSGEVVDQLPEGTLAFGQVRQTTLRGKARTVRLFEILDFARPNHVLLVQSTIKPLLLDSNGFARRFYPRFFRAAPEVERLFVNGTEAQGEMLEFMLRSLVFGLGRTNHLALGLQTLGQKHVAYGVEPRHYDVFRQALLETIEETLGPTRYLPDIAEAWTTVLDSFIGLMTRPAPVP
ncbi:MAG: adenylate/guanylate cyclase domain-containing protein [Geminicoccaceae bacterium]